MTVIKKDRSDSSKDLIKAVEKLCVLLESQDEREAIKSLKEASEQLKSSQPGSAPFKEGVKKIIEAFEDEHELMAYTFQRGGKEWSEAEELSNASSRVITLAKRLG